MLHKIRPELLKQIMQFHEQFPHSQIAALNIISPACTMAPYGTHGLDWQSLSIPAGPRFQQEVGHAFIAHFQRSMQWCSKVPGREATPPAPWNAWNGQFSSLHFSSLLLFCDLQCSQSMLKYTVYKSTQLSRNFSSHGVMAE